VLKSRTTVTFVAEETPVINSRIFSHGSLTIKYDVGGKCYYQLLED